MEKIENFIKTKLFFVNDGNGYGDGNGNGNGYGNGNGDGDGYGDGNGNGNGNGYGNGYGYGNGDGDGDGDGNGNGNGDGYGYGNGYGNGYSYGNGYGYGDGNGNGDGDGNGLKSLNNQNIYIIDKVQTIILSVKGNIAKGLIVNDDLSTTPCFIAKGENYFAHGDTVRKAIEDLQIKLLEKLPIEIRIEKFKEHFTSLTKKYKSSDFYSWHTSLTGSCDCGKQSFIYNNNIDLKKDKFSVKEFINLVKDSYGSDIIKKLNDSYKF